MINESGIHPKGVFVLVLPEQKKEKSDGGIILTTPTVEREEMAQMDGVVVEVGPGAWLDQKAKDQAKPGEPVVFGRYAGVIRTGKDGKKYRLIKDLDIIAGLELDSEQNLPYVNQESIK